MLSLSRVALRNASTLKSRVKELIPKKQAEIKEVKDKYGEKIIGQCTVNQAYGGMRGARTMITETSLLDPEEGIRFRGLSIPEVQHFLPKAEGGEEPLPEALLWLLLTGEVPTKQQTSELSADLSARSHVPEWVLNTLKALPKDLHPMSQLITGVTLLQKDSLFAQAYQKGTPKGQYWDTTFEDSLNLIAKLPTVAATIYRHTYHNDKFIAPNQRLDWGANLAHQMGFENTRVHDLMRLYLVIHSDHEGGNVSAHATHLVGSALSDPYLSYAGGMAGLAGPLHGLANQEVLRWLKEFQKKLPAGQEPTAANVEKALWETLNAGQVIPGFGHAVLRKTDPRYTCQREFCQKHLPNDPLFKLVSMVYEVAPKVLTKQGKTKNPWPNVDAHSGCLLTHYGITEETYYTVLFGVSRGLGVLSSLVWDRALGFPIERPKSMTTEWVRNYFNDPNAGTPASEE